MLFSQQCIEGAHCQKDGSLSTLTLLSSLKSFPTVMSFSFLLPALLCATPLCGWGHPRPRADLVLRQETWRVFCSLWSRRQPGGVSGEATANIWKVPRQPETRWTEG